MAGQKLSMGREALASGRIPEAVSVEQTELIVIRMHSCCSCSIHQGPPMLLGCLQKPDIAQQGFPMTALDVQHLKETRAPLLPFYVISAALKHTAAWQTKGMMTREKLKETCTNQRLAGLVLTMVISSCTPDHR